MESWIERMANPSGEGLAFLNLNYPDLTIEIEFDEFLAMLREASGLTVLVFETLDQRRQIQPEATASCLQVFRQSKHDPSQGMIVCASLQGLTDKDAEAFAKRLNLVEESRTKGWRVWRGGELS
jgi:hypothetical protein